MNGSKKEAYLPAVFVGGELDGQEMTIEVNLEQWKLPFCAGPDASPPANPGIWRYAKNGRPGSVEVYQWIGCMATGLEDRESRLLLVCFDSDNDPRRLHDGR